MAYLRALLILPILSACTGGQTRAPAYSYPPARLELKIAPEVAPEDFSKYQLKVTNIYDRRLWVNRSLGVLSPRQPAGLGEVFLDVRGPSGEVKYSCKDQVDFPTKENYVVLEPGESITSAGALHCFNLKLGDTYTARAHYHDRNPDVPLSPPSAIHLSTEIISEPVQFKIVECPPDLADAGWCDPNKSRDH